MSNGEKPGKLYFVINGVPLGDSLPPVIEDAEHTLMYEIPKYGLTANSIPKPCEGNGIWDEHHVRMPHLEKNSKNEFKRWSEINHVLTKKIVTTEDLIDTIRSYNPKYKTLWQFKALCTLLDEHWDASEKRSFFKYALPNIARRATELPQLIKKPIPLLKKGRSKSISLSQQQISCLLANAFFCTFPRRNAQSKSEYHNYSFINFSKLYETDPKRDPSVLEKLKCFMTYFAQVCAPNSTPTGVVTFSRRFMHKKECPNWGSSQNTLDIPSLFDADIHIEDARGLIQLDFANKYLGGGVLGYGCVQEEIRFTAYPELLVSMLFTEELDDTEAFMMIGATRYSNYTGYAKTFTYEGKCTDTPPIDSSNRAQIALLAIDALPFSSKSEEFLEKNIRRELNKAYVGFSYPTGLLGDAQFHYPGVATGNWGCGAFGGTPQLKSLIQLMACAEASRPIAYFTFHDEKLKDGLIEMHNFLVTNNITVGNLYTTIMNYDDRKRDLFSFVKSKLTQLTTVQPPIESNPQRSDKTPVGKRRKITPLQDNSPDLFSQDEDQSFKSGNVNSQTHSSNTDSQNFIDQAIVILNSEESDDDSETASNTTDGRIIKMATSNKIAAAVTKSSTNKTLRLFDEMHKFDNVHGRLNLSTQSTAKRSNDNEPDSVSPIDEVKKKKFKITDYFNKRNT